LNLEMPWKLILSPVREGAPRQSDGDFHSQFNEIQVMTYKRDPIQRRLPLTVT